MWDVGHRAAHTDRAQVPRLLSKIATTTFQLFKQYERDYRQRYSKLFDLSEAEKRSARDPHEQKSSESVTTAVTTAPHGLGPGDLLDGMQAEKSDKNGSRLIVENALRSRPRPPGRIPSSPPAYNGNAIPSQHCPFKSKSSVMGVKIGASGCMANQEKPSQKVFVSTVVHVPSRYSQSCVCIVIKRSLFD